MMFTYCWCIIFKRMKKFCSSVWIWSTVAARSDSRDLHGNWNGKILRDYRGKTLGMVTRTRSINTETAGTGTGWGILRECDGVNFVPLRTGAVSWRATLCAKNVLTYKILQEWIELGMAVMGMGAVPAGLGREVGMAVMGMGWEWELCLQDWDRSRRKDVWTGREWECGIIPMHNSTDDDDHNDDDDDDDEHLYISLCFCAAVSYGEFTHHHWWAWTWDVDLRRFWTCVGNCRVCLAPFSVELCCLKQ